MMKTNVFKHRLLYPSPEWRTWATPLSAAEKAECAELTAWFKRAGLPVLWTIEEVKRGKKDDDE
jgi:hypothetical protein